MAPGKKATKPSAQLSPNCLFLWAKRVGILAVLLATFAWLDTIKVSASHLIKIIPIDIPLKERWYVFEPGFLHELAQSAIASSPNDTAGMINHIVTNLTETYPKNKISINTKQEWVFNNAGGAMGAMYIIHASITEYLIIFGTPLGTEGHSGIHTADDYFHILVGEQWAFKPGQLEMERYTPGMVHLMPRGVAKQYKMHEGCWALEYARGQSFALELT